MAHRLRPLRIPSLNPAAAFGQLAEESSERWTAVRAAWRHDPVRFAWLALWSPFWVASDAPLPALPGTPRSAGATPPTPAGELIAAKLDSASRTFWISWFIGSMFRGVTLALLVLSAWSLLAVLGPLSLPGWWAVMAVLAAGAALGAIHGWFLRPDRLMIARMLDRTFSLDERIMTALDREADDSYVSRLQLADAANTLNEILTEIPRSTFVPVRETALCLVALGALVTAMLANVPQDPIDPMGNSPVPGFVPASDRLAVQETTLPQSSRQQPPQAEQSLAEMQEQSQQAQSARDDLETIGQALESNPLTQPAADSIASGDYSGAADQLRGASTSVGNMPQQQRDALADDLEEAAAELEETNPELAQSARDAAEALREGGPDAEQALNDLADQIDQTGETAQQPSDSSPNLDESQAGESEGESAGEAEQGGQSGSSEGDQGGQQDSSGQSSEPGSGSDAAPGVTNSEDQGSSSEQSGETGEGSSSQEGGDAPQDGDTASGSSSESGSGAGTTGDESGGDQSAQAGAPDEETDSGQGSGAGTGQSNANDQAGESGDSAQPGEGADPDAEVPEGEEAGDPPASREDRGEEDDGTGSSSNSSSSLELEGTSDENIPAGNNSGTSSLGSGSGSSTSSGDQGQGEVGVAGPDSNHVPENVRDIVQDFFTGQRP